VARKLGKMFTSFSWTDFVSLLLYWGFGIFVWFFGMSKCENAQCLLVPTLLVLVRSRLPSSSRGVRYRGHTEVSRNGPGRGDRMDAKGKRKASNAIDFIEDSTRLTARMLGGYRQRDDAPVKEIVSSAAFGGSWGVVVGKMSLPVLAILTSLTAEIEGSESFFEGKDSEDDGMCSCFLGCFSLILMRFGRIDRGANTVVGLSPDACVGCESNLLLLC